MSASTLLRSHKWRLPWPQLPWKDLLQALQRVPELQRGLPHRPQKRASSMTFRHAVLCLRLRDLLERRLKFLFHSRRKATLFPAQQLRLSLSPGIQLSLPCLTGQPTTNEGYETKSEKQIRDDGQIAEETIGSHLTRVDLIAVTDSITPNRGISPETGSVFVRQYQGMYRPACVPLHHYIDITTSIGHWSLEALIQLSVRLSAETLTEWQGSEMIRGDHGMMTTTEEFEVDVSMAMSVIIVTEMIDPGISKSGNEERRIEETIGTIIVATQSDTATWTRIVPCLQPLWRFQGQTPPSLIPPLLLGRLLQMKLSLLLHQRHHCRTRPLFLLIIRTRLYLAPMLIFQKNAHLRRSSSPPTILQLWHTRAGPHYRRRHLHRSNKPIILNLNLQKYQSPKLKGRNYIVVLSKKRWRLTVENSLAVGYNPITTLRPNLGRVLSGLCCSIPN